MSRRRSHPPRARKDRNAASEAPPQADVAAAPTTEAVSMVRLTTHADEVTATPPEDEMAAVDAGWDDVAS
jgi:hypothetical protein